MSSKKLNYTEKIGERLKIFRKKRGLKLADLANALGLSIGYLSEVENNKTGIGQKILIRLRELYNLNVNWLLTGEGEMFEKKPEITSQLNIELIKNVIIEVEKLFQKNNLSLSPNKKAELIIFLYEELLENKTISIKERLPKILKLVS